MEKQVISGEVDIIVMLNFEKLLSQWLNELF